MSSGLTLNMGETPAMRLLFRSCLETSPPHIQRRSFTPARAIAMRHNSVLDQLYQLKRKLLREALEAAPEAPLYKRLCGAANQAADLAWTTAQPLLVFACLFEELAQRVRDDCAAGASLREFWGNSDRIDAALAC